MRRLVSLAMACCLTVLTSPRGSAADGVPISFEIIQSDQASLTAGQKWLKLLGELGTDGARVRPALAGEEIRVEPLGKHAADGYRVVARLISGDALAVPKRTFTLRDVAPLRAWLHRLATEGVEGVTESPGAFSLPPGQLKHIQATLSKPVPFSTQGLRGDHFLARLRPQLGFSLIISPEAKKPLTELVLGDDFAGLASGTAIASALRSAGLMLVPERSPASPAVCRVVRLRQGTASWPVGRVPSEPPAKTFPALTETTAVEVDDMAVGEVLSAIAERLEIPLVFDRRALAARRIDLSAARATIPAKQMSYGVALNRVLGPAKARHELRLDDADKPFLWITASGSR